MAKDEYTDDNIRIEVISDLSIVRNSKEYNELLTAISIFAIELEEIRLTRNPDLSYEYYVETKSGLTIEYILYSGVNITQYSFTTNGTIWDIVNIGSVIRLRDRIVKVIEKFRVYSIEVNFS